MLYVVKYEKEAKGERIIETITPVDKNISQVQLAIADHIIAGNYFIKKELNVKNDDNYEFTFDFNPTRDEHLIITSPKNDDLAIALVGALHRFALHIKTHNNIHTESMILNQLRAQMMTKPGILVPQQAAGQKVVDLNALKGGKN